MNNRGHNSCSSNIRYNVKPQYGSSYFPNFNIPQVPIYLIEQELSTLRQGSLSCLEFYDEVEKKLTLLANKTIMSYETTVADTINEKYRADALRVFIPGLRKPLCDILFASRPADLPSALALAQEVDANHERYVFAANFATRYGDNNNRKGFLMPNGNDRRVDTSDPQLGHKNPHYSGNSAVRQNKGGGQPQGSHDNSND